MLNFIKPFLAVGSHALPTDMLDSCGEGFMWCFANWASTVTGGRFWFFMLLAFCAASYMAISRLGSVRAFGYASFVGMMGGIWFSVMGLIPWWTTSIFILAGVIGIVSMIVSER